MIRFTDYTSPPCQLSRARIASLARNAMRLAGEENPVNTTIDRDLRLLAYKGLADKWALAHGGSGRITSDQLGGELGINPSMVRRDLAGIITGAQRGRGYDVFVMIAGIDRELDRPHTLADGTATGSSRKTFATARAFNVRALANFAIANTTARTMTRLGKCKQIVANAQADTIDGFFVDLQTAQALILVWEAFATDEARAKFERIPLPTLVDFAWKHVRVGNQPTA